MTTLYRPVLIETAEQAEALPIGTVATRAFPKARGGRVEVATRTAPHEEILWPMGFGGFTRHAAMVGWTALVPIEAEEETREHPTRVEERPESAYLQPVQQVRYKTRWETA